VALATGLAPRRRLFPIKFRAAANRAVDDHTGTRTVRAGQAAERRVAEDDMSPPMASGLPCRRGDWRGPRPVADFILVCARHVRGAGTALNTLLAHRRGDAGVRCSSTVDGQG